MRTVRLKLRTKEELKAFKDFLDHAEHSLGGDLVELEDDDQDTAVEEMQLKQVKELLKQLR